VSKKGCFYSEKPEEVRIGGETTFFLSGQRFEILLLFRGVASSIIPGAAETGGMIGNKIKGNFPVGGEGGCRELEKESDIFLGTGGKKQLSEGLKIEGGLLELNSSEAKEGKVLVNLGRDAGEISLETKDESSFSERGLEMLLLLLASPHKTIKGETTFLIKKRREDSQGKTTLGRAFFPDKGEKARDCSHTRHQISPHQVLLKYRVIVWGNLGGGRGLSGTPGL